MPSLATMLCCALPRHVFLGVQTAQLLGLVFASALIIRTTAVLNEVVCDEDALDPPLIELKALLSIYGIFVAAYAVGALIGNFAVRY